MHGHCTSPPNTGTAGIPASDLNVAELEAKIEQLVWSAERCRKLGLIARAVAAAGGLLLLATLTGLLRDALGLVAGTAALLGGLALQGSNRTTRDQILAELSACEAQRADLIDAFDLQVVQTSGLPPS